MKNGDTRRGPRSRSSKDVSAMPSTPPNGATRTPSFRAQYGAAFTGLRPCHAKTVSARRRSAFGVLFEEFDRVADGQNGFGRVIGNLATKFLFERHDELDRIEAIGAEIIDEAGDIRNLVGLDAQMLHDDLLYPLANITHCSNLFVQREPINAVLVLSWATAMGPTAMGRCDSEADMRPALQRSGSPAPVAVRLPHFISVDQRCGSRPG